MPHMGGVSRITEVLKCKGIVSTQVMKPPVDHAEPLAQFFQLASRPI